MKAKRILSLLLSLIMIIGLITVPAMAENEEETEIIETDEFGAELNDDITEEETSDAVITVPDDATLFVGIKDSPHFVTFTEIEPVDIMEDGGNIRYSFNLENDTTYNYRVSGENYVTMGGTFVKTPDFSLEITKEQLQPEGIEKNTVERDPSSNEGYNVADIFLNINPKGYLQLGLNETYGIVSLRNWEAVNSTMDNYFIEPDFHYNVIDENGNPSDVVSVDENGIITADKSGTAIVLVTYDAMNLDFGSGTALYGAIWPENTGVFVVSVGSDDSEILTGMTINNGKNNPEIKLSGDYIDSEHDCIYFMGEIGEYTFTPITDGVAVSVANPVVDTVLTFNGFEKVEANTDGSFTVPLTQGRNIVKLEKDGKAEYQVITAKKVEVTINSGETVHPGDTLSIKFDKVYHPANKLAGVYNMSALLTYTDVSCYEGAVIGSAMAQYDFASNEDVNNVTNILKEKDVWGSIEYEKDMDLIVPVDYPYDTFTLSGGVVYASGWGDSYGNHRGITYENGKGPNNYADAKNAWFGKLPDIEIPVVATTADLTEIILDTENVKTDYFKGEVFDKSNLVVTAVYSDGTTQLVTNYTVTPGVLTADTTAVTVTYRGKNASLPVTVISPKVTAIEITTPPAKTAYKEGETFNPSGMVVNAVYENGTKDPTIDYSYAPTKELETTDTEMVITYIGDNGTEGIQAVTLPITVTEKSSGGGTIDTATITVYFTLLGDEIHGAPSGKSDTHTKKAGNLETWVPKTKITLDKGSSILDAVVKGLSLNGIPYTEEGEYISEIRGLGEFDNGPYSGWMYMLNGKYPTLGISEQTLKTGDAIIFHYSDDYTVEKTTYLSSSSSTTINTKNDKTEEIKEEAKEEVKETPQPVATPAFADDTFKDVAKTDWHYDAVKYAYENGLMNGTDNGFEPERTMTRAELCTVLWRMAGEPKIKYNNIFNDVKRNEWYTDAICWGLDINIITGYGNGAFGTDDHMTREQIATVLYRYVKSKDIDTSVGENTNILSYEDFDTISEYAISAMQWAVGSGLMKGKSESTLNPKDTATRAEVATLLMRFCEMEL